MNGRPYIGRAAAVHPSQTRSSIWRYIEELKAAEEITIFLTTHYMDEAEHSDRIAIMDQGRIIALDTPAALKASVGKDRVQLQVDDARRRSPPCASTSAWRRRSPRGT